MPSNDITSTNIPSKVPTTDTEEYPVQQHAVQKINEEEYPTNIVDEMANLSLRSEESIQSFLKRAKDLQRRASNANFPSVDQILIDKTLITLPETYQPVTVTFYDQKDRNFKRFMEILSETAAKITNGDAGKGMNTKLIKKESSNRLDKNDEIKTLKEKISKFSMHDENQSEFS